MWSGIWRTFVQTFNVAVVLFVFVNLHGRTEVITVALFGLTYAAIRGGVISNLMLHHSLLVGLQEEFDALKTAVIPGFAVDPEVRAELKTRAEKFSRPFWFEFGGLTMIGLICLYELFVTLIAS